MTAGQLINWGMPALAADMLNALDCQRTLPLYLQASLLPKAERGELVAKAIDAFPQFVRFPNTLEESGGAGEYRRVLVCPAFTGLLLLQQA